MVHEIPYAYPFELNGIPLVCPDRHVSKERILKVAIRQGILAGDWRIYYMIWVGNPAREFWRACPIDLTEFNRFIALDWIEARKHARMLMQETLK